MSLLQGILTRFWKLPLLVGTVSLSYGLLASISPTQVVAGELEFSSGSYPSPPNGPSTANQTGTLLENTTGSTFVTYTPTITITASLSNQQYTNGLVFGATINSSAKTPVSQPVFNIMSAIGSPTNAMFTSNPNSTPGTGISVTNNYAFSLFTTVEPLYSANLATNGRYYYGDITLTFSRPVTDPVIQMTGMGGSSTVGGLLHGHTAEFELVTPGITASKLSGSSYLNVTNNKILNNATAITASCSTGAACGSVKFAGTNITSLTFRVYVRGDSQPGPWSNPVGYGGDLFLFGGVSIAKPVTVSGTVFDDANGLTDSAINGTGTNAGGLFANLVDSNGKVVASTAVNSNGTYSFLAIGAGQYTVSLSTTAGVQGQTAPASSLPANWVNTGEGTTASGDGTVNGSTAITVNSTDLTGVNFGIQQLPTEDYSDAPSSYGTASHTIVNGRLLGTVITAESAAYNSTLADGDTGDDSITLNGGASGDYRLIASTESATNNTITINASASGFASLWIDYNQNGNFTDPGEQVLNDANVSAGNTTLSFSVPSTIVPGYTFARVRYNTVRGTANTPTGQVSGGEVEDYAFKVPKSTAPLACSASSSLIYTSLDFRHFERVDATTHWARRAGTLPNGKVVDVRFTRTALTGSISSSDRWDARTVVEVAPSDAVTQTNNDFNDDRGFTLDIFEAGTLTPIAGNFIFTFGDIDGHNRDTTPADGIGDRNPSMPVTSYTNSFEFQSFNGIASYLLSSDTRLYLGPSSTATNLSVLSAASNNFDSSLLNRQLAIRVAWENKSSIFFSYYSGQFGGMDIDAQGYDTLGVTSTCSVNISGTVFNDADSSKLQNGTEAGTNAGGLNAVLVNSNNQVVATAAVASNGTYTFSNVPAYTTYTVQITTATAVINSPPPAITLPTNWVSTGENLNTAIDGTVDSQLTVAVTSTNVTGVNFGIKEIPVVAPRLLLIKRITAINNNATNNPNDTSVPLNIFIDGGTSNDEDNHPNWPIDKNTYLRGAINGGLVKPNDEVEYTIYFLNTNANSKNVRICDLVPNNQTFVENAYNNAVPRPLDTGSIGTDTGIALGFSSSALPITPTVYLTNVQDTVASDRGRFFAPGDTSTPAMCKKFNSSGGVTATGASANTNGAVVVDIVTGNTVIPPATAAGNPPDSYGFIRFRAKVK